MRELFLQLYQNFKQDFLVSVQHIYILPLPLNTLESLEDPFDINL